VLTASIIAMITMMMEAVRASEMSVNIDQTTQFNNPEDSHLHVLNILVSCYDLGLVFLWVFTIVTRQ
jgi:hypothetical protein